MKNLSAEDSSPNFVIFKDILRHYANMVILYVDRKQAKRVEKEEGCDGKKRNIFLVLALIPLGFLSKNI